MNIHELNYHKNIQSKFPSHPSSPSNPSNNSTKNNSRISAENLNSLNIRILENGQKCLDEDINGNLAHLSSKLGLNKENEVGSNDINNNNNNNNNNYGNDTSDNNCFSDLDEKPCFSDLSICENRERKKNNLIIDLTLVQNILNQNKCRVAEAHLYASLLNNNTITVPNHNIILETEAESFIDTENPFLNHKLIDNNINQDINKNDNNIKIEKSGFNNNEINNIEMTNNNNKDNKSNNENNNNNINNNNKNNNDININDETNITNIDYDENITITTPISQSHFNLQNRSKVTTEKECDNAESGSGIPNHTHRFFSSSANRINEKYNKSSQQTTHADARVTDAVLAACTYNTPLYVTPEDNPLWQITQQKLIKNRDFVTQEARRRLLNRRKAWIEIGNR